MLDTFLVFLVLFNYVIPISLYVTVGRYPERYGTVSLCKKRLLLNIAPPSSRRVASPAVGIDARRL